MNDIVPISLPGCKGWAEPCTVGMRILDPNVSIEQIGMTVQNIGNAKSALRWILGDLGALCQARGDGDEVFQWIDPSVMSLKSYQNSVAVAKKFPIERRRPNLTWEHHNRVCGVPDEIAEQLLDWAYQEAKSTADLKMAVKEYQNQVLKIEAEETGVIGKVGLANASEVEWLMYKLGQFSEQVRNKGTTEVFFHLDRDVLQSGVTIAMDALSEAMPIDLCPECSGFGCPMCHNLGWATRKMIDDHEMRKELE